MIAVFDSDQLNSSINLGYNRPKLDHIPGNTMCIKNEIASAIYDYCVPSYDISVFMLIKQITSINVNLYIQ